MSRASPHRARPRARGAFGLFASSESPDSSTGDSRICAARARRSRRCAIGFAPRAGFHIALARVEYWTRARVRAHACARRRADVADDLARARGWNRSRDDSSSFRRARRRRWTPRRPGARVGRVRSRQTVCSRKNIGCLCEYGWEGRRPVAYGSGAVRRAFVSAESRDVDTPHVRLPHGVVAGWRGEVARAGGGAARSRKVPSPSVLRRRRPSPVRTADDVR